MRLFLGSFAHISNLAEIQRDFPMLKARWTPKENIHLTYLFLGDKLSPESIIQKLQDIEYPTRDIPLSGLGTFGKPPHILYTKAQDQALHRLHREITKRLDIIPDKPFVPHITLARIKRVEDMSAFRKMVDSYKEKVLGEMQTELQLIKSTLMPEGVKYEILHHF